MENIENIINELNNGNRRVIEDFIVYTRLHVLNTARSIVKKDEEAIAIAEDVYNEILINSKNIQSEKSFVDYINKIIVEKSKKYSKEKNKFKKQKNNKKNINLESINIENYKDYYNNPKVERIIYETINSLPSEEKTIVIDNYFLNKSIDEISKERNIDIETINSYLNNANHLIDKKSKPLFIKDKIINADYSGVEVVYSTIKLGISIMSLDIIGIAVDKIEEELQDEDDDKKDLKDFIKDVIKDLVKDWFIDRIKSAVLTGVTAAVATNIATVKTTKTVGVSLVKKVVIGAITTSVVATGAVAVYNISQNSYDKKVEKIKDVEPAISIDSQYKEFPVTLNAYCNNDTNEINSIYLDVNVSNDKLNSKQLSLIEVSSKAVSGLDIYSKEDIDDTTIHVVVEKEKINENLITFVESLNVVDQDILDKAKQLLESDKDELLLFLKEYGFID